MAIQYVGGVTSGRAGSTSTTTQSLSGTLAGGIAASPAAGDLVVVYCSVGWDTTAATSQTISGNNSGAYSNEAFQSVDDTNDSGSQLNYQRMGATPDTSLTIPSSASIRNAQRWVVHVFRNVDAATPLDVAAVPASGINTGRPDPAAITPSTAGAWIVAFYASAAAAGTAYTAPTDFATDWLGGTQADTVDCMQGGGYYTGWTSGAYNPAAITAGGTTGTGDSWTAMTIALRPSDTTLTVTGIIGTATASGYTAQVDKQIVVTGIIGVATANGYTAQVDRQTLITGIVGTATANGFTAQLDIQKTIAGIIGIATADGYQATIDLPSGGITIDCILAEADAAGFTTNVDLQTNINGQLSTAGASGFTANIDVQITISGTLGQAVADGYLAIISFPGGSRLKYWNGGTWEAKQLKQWNGVIWELKPLKYWNGSAWE